MSNLPLIPTLVGVVACGIGAAAYHKTSALQEEVQQLKAQIVQKPSDDGLEGELRRLEGRVALLEVRARITPHESEPRGAGPTAPPPPDPSAAADPERPEDVGPKDRSKREEHRRRAVTTIDDYWKRWGAKHGLTQAQTDSLTAMQVDVAKRKLDNQERMTDRLMTQPEVKAANRVMTDDLRKKAQALLTPEQFTQFEAEDGAQFGSSYRNVRERAKALTAP